MLAYDDLPSPLRTRFRVGHKGFDYDRTDETFRVVGSATWTRRAHAPTFGW